MHVQRTCLMYHAGCKVEFQPFNWSYSQRTFFLVKLSTQSINNHSVGLVNKNRTPEYYK